MTVKAVDQTTVVDVTDAYSVILDNEAHTFIGSTSTLGTAQTTTAKITAMLGGSVVAASVTLSEVTAPSGVTVTKDSDVTSPTITARTAAAACHQSGRYCKTTPMAVASTASKIVKTRFFWLGQVVFAIAATRNGRTAPTTRAYVKVIGLLLRGWLR